MVNLKEYLRIKRITPKDFALKTGIGMTSIYRYIKGTAPTFARACEIEKFTDGKVSVEELRKNHVERT